jgi:methyl-accepting chemotaxis protein
MRNVENDFDLKMLIDPRVGVLVKESRPVRSVNSLTDELLHSKFEDWETRQRTDVETATEGMSLFAYHLTQMKGASLCYVPPEAVEEGGELPTIDIGAMTSIGAAMAMLILSVIQNEVMLNTQIEGVKGTQNQKISASQTKILKVKQQIQKSRIKTGFQKFMEWLSSTWLMKFLNSNYGKVIMFIIGAAATIASFGAAGPAMVAINCVLLSFQAAELIMGKSMGELLTQSMDDGSAKMALQMSIDVGLMVASMAAGGGGGAKADKAGAAAGDAAEAGQKASLAVSKVKDAAKAVESAAKTAENAVEVVEAAQNVQKTATEAMETLEDVTKLAKQLESLVQNGGSVAEIAEKTQELEKAMEKAAAAMEKMNAAMDNLKKVSEAAGIGDDLMGMVTSTQKLVDNAMDSAQNVQKLGQEAAYMAKKMVAMGTDRTMQAVEQTMEVSEKTSDAAAEAKDAAKAVESAAENMDGAADVAAKAKKVQETADEVMDATEEVKKAGDAMQRAIVNGGSSAEIAEKTQQFKAAVNKMDSAMDRMDDAKKEMKAAMKGLENSDAANLDEIKDLKKTVEKAVKQTDSALKKGKKAVKSGENAVDLAKKSKTAEINLAPEGTTKKGEEMDKWDKVKNFAGDAARFVLGIGGLEHLSYVQQVTIAMEKFQKRMQALLEFYQALYKLAMSEEEARKVTHAGIVNAINTEADALQEFLQMIIDHQVADMQSLMSSVKAAVERATEEIREYGETNRMITQNIMD